MTELALARSFVYGLDYIDEVVAQIMPAPVGEDPALRWVLQDANYNVVGLARECDNLLIRQFRYQPYGDFERNGPGHVTGIEEVDAEGTVARLEWYGAGVRHGRPAAILDKLCDPAELASVLCR